MKSRKQLRRKVNYLTRQVQSLEWHMNEFQKRLEATNIRLRALEATLAKKDSGKPVGPNPPTYQTPAPPPKVWYERDNYKHKHTKESK